MKQVGSTKNTLVSKERHFRAFRYALGMNSASQSGMDVSGIPLPSPIDDRSQSRVDRQLCLGDIITLDIDRQRLAEAFRGFNDKGELEFLCGCTSSGPSDGVVSWKNGFVLRSQRRYRATKAYKQALEEYHVTDDDFEDEDGSGEAIVRTSPLLNLPFSIQTMLRELRLKKMAEEKHNMELSTRAHGRPLLYGSVVQVFNLQSFMFLELSQEPGRCEPYAQRLRFSETGSSGSWFVIVSATNSRVSGEKVRLGDPIILKSKKFNTYMHVAAATFPEGEYAHVGIAEMVGCPTPSRWTTRLMMSSTVPIELFASGLMAGSVVTLFHDHCHSCLRGDRDGNQFVRVPRIEKSDDFGFIRDRSQMHRQGDAISLSVVMEMVLEETLYARRQWCSDVYWRIFPAESMGVNSSIVWGQDVRIVHLLTNSFLAAVPSTTAPSGYDLRLVPFSATADDSSVFQPFPMYAQEGFIFASESSVRFQHKRTRLWVVAPESARNMATSWKLEWSRVGGSAQASGTLPASDSLRAKTAGSRPVDQRLGFDIQDVGRYCSFVPLELSGSVSDEDAVSIKGLAGGLPLAYRYVAMYEDAHLIQRLLRGFVERFRMKQTTSTDLASVSTVLTFIANMCNGKVGNPICPMMEGTVLGPRSFQILCVDAHVYDPIMEILKIPFELGVTHETLRTAEYDAISQLFDTCIRALHALTIDNARMASKWSEPGYVRFFVGYLTLVPPSTVIRFLKSVVEAFPSIRKSVDEKDVNKMYELFTQFHGTDTAPLFLENMSMMANCHTVAAPHLQLLLTRKFLVENPNSLPCISFSGMQDGKANLLVSDCFSNSRQCFRQHLSNVANDASLYHIGILRFCSSLVAGGNMLTLPRVRQQYPMEMLVHCSMCEDIRPDLRAAFIGLLEKLYIDQFVPSRDQVIQLNRVLQESGSSDVISSSASSVRMSDMSKSRQDALLALKSYVFAYINNRRHIRLHFEAPFDGCELMSHFVNLGMKLVLVRFICWWQELPGLCDSIARVLNVTRDFLVSKGSQKDDPSLRERVRRLAVSCLDSMDLVADIALNKRATMLLDAFNKYYANCPEASLHSTVAQIQETKQWANAEEHMKTEASRIFSEINFASFLSTEEKAKSAAALAAGSSSVVSPSLMEVLLNMLRTEGIEDISGKAFVLMIRLFRQKDELLSVVSQINVLLSDRERKIYTDVLVKVHTFNACCTGCSGSYLASDGSMLLERSVDRRLALVRIISQMTVACRPGSANRLVYQRSLSSLGFHQAVLSLLRHYSFPFLGSTGGDGAATCDAGSAVDMQCDFALHTSIFRFLSNFVGEFSRNQSEVYRWMALLLENLSLNPKDVSLCIQNVLKGNLELCAQLPESFVDTVVQCIVEHGRRPEFLEILRSILTVNGNPIKRNQSLVTKHLSGERSSAVLVSLDAGTHGTDAGELCPLFAQSCSTETHSQDDEYRLQLVLLFAAASQGQNAVAEDRLRALAPLEELMNMIIQQYYGSVRSLAMKAALLDLFKNLYINTDSGGTFLVGHCSSILDGDSITSDSCTIWDVLRSLAVDIDVFKRDVYMESEIEDSSASDPAEYTDGSAEDAVSPSQARRKYSVLRPSTLPSGFAVYLHDSVLPFVFHFYHRVYKEVSLAYNQADVDERLTETLSDLPVQSSYEERRLMRCLHTIHTAISKADGPRNPLKLSRLVDRATTDGETKGAAEPQTAASRWEFLRNVSKVSLPAIHLLRAGLGRGRRGSAYSAGLAKGELSSDMALFSSRTAFIWRKTESSSLFRRAAHAAVDLHRSRMLRCYNRVAASLPGMCGYEPGSDLFHFSELLSKRDDIYIEKMFGVLREHHVDADSVPMLLDGLRVLCRVIDSLKDPEDIARMQSRFLGLGAVEALVSLVSCTEPRIIDVALEFGLTLFRNGHREVQRRFIQLCSSRLTAHMVENFWVSLSSRMDAGINEFKQRKFYLERLEDITYEQRLAQTVSEFDDDFGSGFAESIRELGDPDGSQGEEDLVRKLERRADATGFILNTLKFLQLLCEGHYLPLQHFLRKQHTLPTSIDFVSKTMQLLNSIEKFIDDEKVLDIAIQLYRTLTEMIQGPCPENQKLLFNSEFCYVSINLMDLFLENNEPSKALRLKHSIIVTFNSMMEGGCSEDSASLLVKSIDMEVVVSYLDFLLTCMKTVRSSCPDIAEVWGPFGMSVKGAPPPGSAFLSVRKPSFSRARSDSVVSIEGSAGGSNVQNVLSFSDAITIRSYMQAHSDQLSTAPSGIDAYGSTRSLSATSASSFDDTSSSGPFSSETVSGSVSLYSLASPSMWMSGWVGGPDQGRGFLWYAMNDSTLQKSLEVTAVDTLILLKQLKERCGSDVSYPVNLKAYAALDRRLASVEILHNDHIHRMHFPLSSASRFLRRKSRKEIQLAVNRSDANSKLKSFMGYSDFLIEEMNFQRDLQKCKSYTYLKYSSRNLKLASFLIALVMNFIMLAKFEADDPIGSPGSGGITLSGASTDVALYALGSVQLLIYCAILYVYFVGEAPMKLVLHYRPQIRCGQCVARDVIPRDGYRKFVMQATRICLFDWEFAFSFFAVIFSILGLSSSFLYFSYHLFAIMIRFTVLFSVIRSLTLNGRTLLLTSALGLIIVYVYSLIGFMYFRQDFVVDLTGEAMCTSLLKCFGAFLNYGMRASAFWEDILRPDSRFSRILLDMMFFSSIIIIVLNLIFGLILDSFATLRQRRADIENDIRNRCFICSKDRAEFDLKKRANYFPHHVRAEHSMWNYIFLMQYLQGKERLEFTGLEDYVFEHMKRNSIAYFPINRAQCLEGSK